MCHNWPHPRRCAQETARDTRPGKQTRGVITPYDVGMVHRDQGMVRVTITLLPGDVELLDRVAALDGDTRSGLIRHMIESARPHLQNIAKAYGLLDQRRSDLEEALHSAGVKELEQIVPEVRELEAKTRGALAKLEGARAASDPHPSNHGGQKPVTPPTKRPRRRKSRR